MINIDELRQALGAVQPEEVGELLDRLEAAEQTAQDYLRIDEEKARIAQRLEAAEKERDALRAKIASITEAWKSADRACHDLTKKVIPNLREQVEAAEKERDDVAQQLVQSEQGKRKISEECDALSAELSKQQTLTVAAQHIAEVAQRRANQLQAKIAEMERQEPVAWMDRHGTLYNSVSHVRPSDKPLYALPGAQNASSFADAYQGAMEEVAIWKKRALEAEELNRKFIAEINGPTYMGEPAQPAPNAVAYLDIGAGGYRDIGTDLTDDALAAIHMLGIIRKYGVDGYLPAQPAPSVPDGWKLVPIEPAQEMIDHVIHERLGAFVAGKDHTFIDIYKAMLAAAPEAKPCP